MGRQNKNNHSTIKKYRKHLKRANYTTTVSKNNCHEKHKHNIWPEVSITSSLKNNDLLSDTMLEINRNEKIISKLEKDFNK